MSLTKETVEDKIEVLDCGAWKMVQVRTATVIKDDGTEISRRTLPLVYGPTITLIFLLSLCRAVLPFLRA